jgi:hypothetical protein
MHKPIPLVFAGVILALAVSVTARPASSSSTGTPSCTASQLKGKLLDSNGAAGTILMSITLQNTRSTCVLKGYPGLRLVGVKGGLPTRVVHGGIRPLNVKAKPVRLVHRGKASVLISYEDVPVGNETRCPEGSTILLRPPGAQDWVVIRAKTYACGHGTLHESPVLAGVQSSG